MRHLISLKEQSKEELLLILETAKRLKRMRINGEETNFLHNKNLVMLFQKETTRTRLSYEVAMAELGGHAVFLDYRHTQYTLIDFQDEIRAAMCYGDALLFRSRTQNSVAIAASYNQKPVIDASNIRYHPAQALADVFTMSEFAGGLENIKKVAWLGRGDCVLNSLLIILNKLEIPLTIVAPESCQDTIDEDFWQEANANGIFTCTDNLQDGLKDADFVHTDSWLDLENFENGRIKKQHLAEHEKEKTLYKPYQLNEDLILNYFPNAKIMHRMPCFVGCEITRGAIDHPNSIILKQAENRLHAQKAMILWVLQKEVA